MAEHDEEEEEEEVEEVEEEEEAEEEVEEEVEAGAWPDDWGPEPMGWEAMPEDVRQAAVERIAVANQLEEQYGSLEAANDAQVRAWYAGQGYSPEEIEEILQGPPHEGDISDYYLRHPILPPPNWLIPQGGGGGGGAQGPPPLMGTSPAPAATVAGIPPESFLPDIGASFLSPRHTGFGIPQVRQVRRMAVPPMPPAAGGGFYEGLGQRMPMARNPFMSFAPGNQRAPWAGWSSF